MKSTYTGVAVNPGYVKARAYVVSDENTRPFTKGDILVVPYSHPRYSLMLFDAGGLVCETGAVMAHICIIAGEIGLPCLTQVADATRIADGSLIEVDSEKGEVRIVE
ncbi:PEP-utilizing enzyme [Paenibacillus agilis]|uniref:PEP-utilising enzyme mobile domain-containing protein n=1 Tax=Paenibacillus agilis TaxID=3020863 RepID=A0A559J0Z7_9BACL|nr:PEP-utilizing enzyme [Paenibacillus agilis]TVX93565.1 hypothetical protein FPZ44_11170 [Paenibacillus agilis]